MQQSTKYAYLVKLIFPSSHDHQCDDGNSIFYHVLVSTIQIDLFRRDLHPSHLQPSLLLIRVYSKWLTTKSTVVLRALTNSSFDVKKEVTAGG